MSARGFILSHIFCRDKAPRPARRRPKPNATARRGGAGAGRGGTATNCDGRAPRVRDVDVETPLVSNSWDVKLERKKETRFYFRLIFRFGTVGTEAVRVAQPDMGVAHISEKPPIHFVA